MTDHEREYITTRLRALIEFHDKDAETETGVTHRTLANAYRNALGLVESAEAIYKPENETE